MTSGKKDAALSMGRCPPKCMLPSKWAKLFFYYDTIYVQISSIPGITTPLKRELKTHIQTKPSLSGYIKANDLMTWLDSATDQEKLQTDLDNLVDWPLVTVLNGTRAVNMGDLTRFLQLEIPMAQQRKIVPPWNLYPPQKKHIPQQGYVTAAYAQLIVDMTRYMYDVPSLHWMTEFYDVSPATRTMTLGSRTVLVSGFGKAALEWKSTSQGQFVRPLCKEGSEVEWKPLADSKTLTSHVYWEFDDIYPSPTDADTYIETARARRYQTDRWRIQETGMTDVAKRDFRIRLTSAKKRVQKKRTRAKEPMIVSQKTLIINDLPDSVTLAVLTDMLRSFDPIELRVSAPKAVVSLKTAMGAQRAQACLRDNNIVAVFAVL